MKLIITIYCILLLFSCSSNQKEKPGIIEESSNIVDDYGQNLGDTVKDAKNIKNTYENNNKALEQQIQNVR